MNETDIASNWLDLTGISIFLGLVQGLTEFLPVSSSGHLVLFQSLLHSDKFDLEFSLAFDALVHLATLVAVCIFLRKELIELTFKTFKPNADRASAHKLVLMLAIATLPAAIVGLVWKDVIEDLFSSAASLKYGFLTTTVFLLSAHFYSLKHEKSDKKLLEDIPSGTQALLIGVFQAIAIIPGISRSGSTIAVALLSGLSKDSALRFSFLLALPTIFGAFLLQAGSLLNLAATDLLIYMLGFVVAMVSGIFALRVLVVFTKKNRLIWFGIYTLILSFLV